MYMIAIASFVGWVFFAVFGGIGLVALPFDLMIEFKNRPRRISLQQYKYTILSVASLTREVCGDEEGNRRTGGSITQGHG